MADWILLALGAFVATLVAICVSAMAVSFMLFPLGTAAGVAGIMAALVLLATVALAVPGGALAYYLVYGHLKKLELPSRSSSGGPIEYVSLSKSNAIHWAAYHGRFWHNLLLKIILARGEDPDVQAGSECFTPLHWAAARGNAAAAHILLQQQPDIDSRDATGWTPLHYAVHLGHLKCAEELLESGAEVDSRADGGRTPLMLACHSKCPPKDDNHTTTSQQIVKLLIANNADVNATEPEMGWTPLHMLCYRGNDAALAEFLTCRDVNLLATTSSGKFALEKAVLTGHSHTVQTLLTSDAWTKLPSNESSTAVQNAIQKAEQLGKKELLDFLMHGGRPAGKITQQSQQLEEV